MTTLTFVTITKDSPGTGQFTAVGTYASTFPTQPSQVTTVGDLPATNQRWSRFMRLTNAILQIGRNGSSNVAITLASLSKLARTIERTLTWPPAITTQPSDSSTSFAKGLLTFLATTLPSNGQIVTLNAQAYTFKTVLVDPFDVLIDASGGTTAIKVANTLDNLKAAVNDSAGEGTLYGTGTTAHATIHATTNTDTTQLFEARVVGTAANAYACTTNVTSATITNPATGATATTLLGGTAAATFAVVSVNEDDSPTYQWQYADATVKATGLLTSNGTIPTDGDTIRIGQTLYTLRTALTSPAVANEVLIGGSAAVMLDNLKLAINAGAGVGTNYSTGTVANAQVTATTNTNTTQVVEALVAGETANAYLTLKDSATLQWGASTLINGGWASATGTVLKCVYTNGTTATLTCTPTTSAGDSGTGQSGVLHRCAVTNTAGTTGTRARTLTIT